MQNTNIEVTRPWGLIEVGTIGTVRTALPNCFYEVESWDGSVFVIPVDHVRTFETIVCDARLPNERELPKQNGKTPSREDRAAFLAAQALIGNDLSKLENAVKEAEKALEEAKKRLTRAKCDSRRIERRALRLLRMGLCEAAIIAQLREEVISKKR